MSNGTCMNPDCRTCVQDDPSTWTHPTRCFPASDGKNCYCDAVVGCHTHPGRVPFEEIHLIIRYPIQETWERLGIVDSVRHNTIKTIKDVALNLWSNITVEEV